MQICISPISVLFEHQYLILVTSDYIYIPIMCYPAKIVLRIKIICFFVFIKYKRNSVKRDFAYNEARVFVMWYNLHIFVIDVMIMLQSIYYLPKHKSWPITKMHVFVVPQTNTAIVI